MKTMRALERLIDGVAAVALALGAIAIAALALIGAVDVIGTSAFHKPLPSALEFSQIALVIVVFLGLAQAQRRNAHITVDIFSQNFQGGLWKLSQTAALIAALCFFGAIAWFGGGEALHSFEISEMSQGAMPVPVWPGRFLLAAGAVIAALVALKQLIVLWLRGGTLSGHDDAKGLT